MSRFRKLTHTLWHCQYHIIWTPKYRYRVLEGRVKQETEYSIRANVEQFGAEIVELNVQVDHVHVIVMMAPKYNISNLMGRVKGKSAQRIFRLFPSLRKTRYWGNKLWASGYCVDTVGINADMIRKYVKHQEAKDIRDEQLRFNLK